MVLGPRPRGWLRDPAQRPALARAGAPRYTGAMFAILSQRAGLLALALAPLLWSGAATAGPPRAAAQTRRPTLVLPLRILVARCPETGKPARSRAWLKAHLRGANRVLAPAGVRLRPEVDAFSPPRCDLHSRAHRHAMARFVPDDGVPTVLVLRRVRDVDVTDYFLMGVHWRYRGKDEALRGRRYVLLTARAEPPVLAHELCHYFGLPHDPAGGNLMTPGPSSPLWQRDPKPSPFAPRLSPRQKRRLRRGVRAQLARIAAARAEKAPRNTTQTSTQERP